LEILNRNIPSKVVFFSRGEKCNKITAIVNPTVPTVPTAYAYTPQDIPAANAANMKIRSLESLKFVLNRIIARAPIIPSPLAKLSPIACIITAETIELNIIA
jgi:hypothetical protein